MEKNRLGQKLATVRETRRLSVDELAARAGVNERIIGDIEAGKLIPSLAPLMKLARGLGVRLGTFLDDSEEVGPVMTKKGERSRIIRFSDKDRPASSDLDFASLAANKAGRHMEPFLIEVHPSSGTAVHPSAHEGEEFMFVVAGAVEILYGRETYRLEAGDSIYLDSIVAHHVHAADDAPATILAVVYAP